MEIKGRNDTILLQSQKLKETYIKNLITNLTIPNYANNNLLFIFMYCHHLCSHFVPVTNVPTLSYLVLCLNMLSIPL